MAGPPRPQAGETSRRFALGERLVSAAQRVNGVSYIGLDYPPAAVSGPRYGWGRPAHAAIEGLLAAHQERIEHELRKILEYRAELLAIPRSEPLDATEPAWISAPVWMLGLDGASLYTAMRDRRPARLFEIGSGMSTRFAARAKRDGRLATAITSIDPSPRSVVDALCERVIRAPLETVQPELFDELEAGDVLFFDGSHRVFMNSDVTTFFLDVLPRLPMGLLVGIHDILLPWDYPERWQRRHYSEQYVLGAQLLAGGSRIEPVLPCFYVGLNEGLAGVLEPLWAEPQLAGVDRRGFAFWFELGPSPL